MTSSDTVGATVRTELLRKAIHLATAGIPVAYALGAPASVVRTGCLALAALALLVELARRTSPAAQQAFERLTGRLLRPHEAAGALTGATWMFVAYAALAWGASRPVAVAAMWAIAAGDATAALVGRFTARRRWPWGKSFEGAAAMALVATLGGWLLAGFAIPAAAVLGLAAAAAESAPLPGDDNLRVAVVTFVTGMLLV